MALANSPRFLPAIGNNYVRIFTYLNVRKNSTISVGVTRRAKATSVDTVWIQLIKNGINLNEMYPKGCFGEAYRTSSICEIYEMFP